MQCTFRFGSFFLSSFSSLCNCLLHFQFSLAFPCVSKVLQYFLVGSELGFSGDGGGEKNKSNPGNSSRSFHSLSCQQQYCQWKTDIS